ncbi:Ig-like domain-containing protein [Brevibacillus sp. SYSU BS000544]|uniref:RCC1 domain-containing protein n=1 Tax=Brevibacillus sp. SYSU BS000544 TaxID=3416443 RepID=UPI003CE4EE33
MRILRVLLSIALLFGLLPLQSAEAAGGITKISGDIEHNLALKDDGTVWAWGKNNFGQLGNDSITNSNVPVKVSGLDTVIDISAGGENSYALKADGTVWSWGNNGVGELGNGNIGSFHMKPVQVVGPGGVGVLQEITSIAGGYKFALALKNDGTVWAWGNNGNGTLGNGTGVSSSTPVQVKDPGDPSQPLTNVVAISASKYAVAAVKADGTVWTWGANIYGGLGMGVDSSVTPRSNLPVQVKDSNEAGGFLTGVKQISAGDAHFLALKTDGTLRAWGNCVYGQLGAGSFGPGIDGSTTAVIVRGPSGESGSSLTNIKNIGTGENHSLAVDQDGNLWAWGYNGYGALGASTPGDQTYPLATGITGMKQAIGGKYYSIGLKNDGTLWGWGYNANGQLGNGTNTNSVAPVQTLIASSNANLSNLTEPSGIITFDPNQTTYTIFYDGSSTTVTPTAADAGATIALVINGGPPQPIASGTTSDPIPLNERANKIDVIVTAEDGVTKKTYTINISKSNPANTPPVAVNSSFTTTVSNAVYGTLSASDVDNDLLTFSIVTDGAKGDASLSNATTGAFSYTPNAGETGTDTFTFKVNDGKVDSNIAIVTVTIEEPQVNQQPTAHNATYTTQVGKPISGTLSASDPDNDSLTYKISTNPDKGSVSLTNPATGAFTYTPGETGSTSFTFVANDSKDDSNVATVTINITSTPPPPPPPPPPYYPVTEVKLDKTELNLIAGGSVETLIPTILPEYASNKQVTWSSSNPAVARVLDNGIVEPLKAGEAIITVTSVDGKKTAECRVTVTAPIKPGIELDKTRLPLMINGAPVKLNATIIPVNADYEIIWKSSDERVAKVDDDGMVTPVALGQATVTAKVKEKGWEAKCYVTVTPKGIIAIEVSEKNLLLMPNKKASVTIYAVMENGKKKNVTFNKDTVFGNDSKKLVSIKKNVITAGKRQGKTTITVTYQGYPIIIPITVSKIGVEELTAEEKRITLREGESLQLDVTALFTNKKTRKVTDEATWHTDKQGIIEVVDGKVVGLKKGKAIIRAIYGGKYVTFYVTVNKAET